MGAESSIESGTVTPLQYWLVSFDGTLLRRRRRDRDLSQERLAYRSRVTLKTIQRVEKLPVASCHFGTLQRLARALSPDPEALISELTAGVSDSLPAPRTQPPRSLRDPWWQRGTPFPSGRTGHARYSAATARELLAMTGEFPNTKSGMLILLAEYRRALYDIATGSAGNST